ncbi:type II toxin-antitoxin system HipA family toxin [Pseudovibrio exalbescens]|uniref:Toxin HipA n=1 Tax=Pseudovibrio exalbescens TaxID=197461 RepID=A0A1U7JKE2_9HYPH|nr:type II toxin-antitoxin system HipA family toxin [Pseudovibrio exalbescens]OKL45111.1 toxin HipA [Pseudovibrio exalbescens]
MGRRRTHVPLSVLLNNRRIGTLIKEPSGAVVFQYDETWLAWDYALPVSLSLPLREEAYRGAPVVAVFENLLPDADALRRRVAERVGAAGTDAYSLLAAIGHDCVGALQFAAGDAPVDDASAINGAVVDEVAIEAMLKGLAQAPLGLSREDPFRISVAGAQEKTALLYHEGQWLKPHGTTPTTHIFKTQIGRLPNGIDLSDSVENEYYCLRFAAACGLPVTSAAMHTFGETKALVIERFDRRWTRDGRLLRLPQEDCCQALSVPPTRKYQNEGGPGLVDLLQLMKGSDDPAADQATLLKAQMLFWLIGATDGHAKNFSVFLGPGGSFQLTPLYDILTAQPSLMSRQIDRKQMKLALSVGRNNHYRLDQIHGRHFLQTAEQARLPKGLVHNALSEIAEAALKAVEVMEQELPPNFPSIIHDSVAAVVRERARQLGSSTV